MDTPYLLGVLFLCNTMLKLMLSGVIIIALNSFIEGWFRNR
mgnify:CR=1 FL=1